MESSGTSRPESVYAGEGDRDMKLCCYLIECKKGVRELVSEIVCVRERWCGYECVRCKSVGEYVRVRGYIIVPSAFQHRLVVLQLQGDVG